MSLVRIQYGSPKKLSRSWHSLENLNLKKLRNAIYLNLEKDLKNTVKWIEKNSDIELLAIGIGHDVTRYYDKAVKIADVQDLGDVMINQLTELFTKKSKNKTIH